MNASGFRDGVATATSAFDTARARARWAGGERLHGVVRATEARMRTRTRVGRDSQSYREAKIPGGPGRPFRVSAIRGAATQRRCRRSSRLLADTSTPSASPALNWSETMALALPGNPELSVVEMPSNRRPCVFVNGQESDRSTVADDAGAPPTATLAPPSQPAPSAPTSTTVAMYCASLIDHRMVRASRGHG
jgi:hypothetical protein